MPIFHAGMYTADPQTSNSPAFADPVERRMSHSFTDPQLSSAAAANRAEVTYIQDSRDDSSVGSGRLIINPLTGEYYLAHTHTNAGYIAEDRMFNVCI